MILCTRDWHVGYAARCGCRTTTAQDVYVPSAARGGVGSSSHAPTGSRGICTEDEDDDHESVDQGSEELGPSLQRMLPGLSLRSRSVPGDVDHLTLTLQAPMLLDRRAKVGLGDSEGFGRFYVRCFHGL
jgi:hypothetical protein